MSPSPTDFTDKKAVDVYANAWAAIMKSARSGSSWSGSETNRTFLNTGGGRFADASYVSGFGFDDDGRALAITDWDGDGDLDLWAHNRTAPRLRLLRNNSPQANLRITFPDPRATATFFNHLRNPLRKKRPKPVNNCIFWNKNVLTFAQKP